MKKVILILALLLVSLSLNAEILSVKFYLQDGNYKWYNISNISEMTFIKSETPYIMEIFIYGTKATYDLNDISSIEFSESGSLLITTGSSTYNIYKLSDIDSINFVPNTAVGITIGVYSWMRRNLDVDHYRNGDPIPQVTDSAEWVNLKTGAWCWYNNNSMMGKTYGKLYNGYAVNDPRGLAPEGWHIPSLEEWAKLSEGLGGDTIAGGKMKTTGTKETGDGLWLTPNEGATNESHFSAYPGGYRSNTFMNLGTTAYYWSSVEEETINAMWMRVLSNDKNAFGKSIGKNSCGYSVRCVEDYITPNITSISPTSPQIGEVITISGTDFGATKGESFVIFNSIMPDYLDYISWSDTQIKVVVPQETVSGLVSVTIKGIKSNEVEFTISTIDPNYFETVKIGNQSWMSRNLNVVQYRNGDTIPQVTDINEWSKLKTGAWCYYNNDSKYETVYGKLYNWYAVNDPRGLAPEGWHVPREEEWSVLMDFLGGSNFAGGKMKTTGTSKDHNGLWKAPNYEATNESNFSALPGGERDEYDFGGIPTDAFFWSATEEDEDFAYSKWLDYMQSVCFQSSTEKNCGYSVRCIKD